MMSKDGSAEYLKFWTQLLDSARGYTDLHVRPTPRNVWYIQTTRNGITYDYALRKHTARVDLWIVRGDLETRETIFQGLQSHKDEIEKDFGDQLIWGHTKGPKQTPMVRFVASHYGFDDRNHWPEIQKALIEAMIRLEAACDPYVDLGE